MAPDEQTDDVPSREQEEPLLLRRFDDDPETIRRVLARLKGQAA